MIKYWKKSNGDCGTVDDTGYVPDSVGITKAEYDEWVASIIVLPEQIEEQRKTNIQSEIIKKYPLVDQIVMLWKLQIGELAINSSEIVEYQQTVSDTKSKYPKV